MALWKRRGPRKPWEWKRWHYFAIVALGVAVIGGVSAVVSGI